MLSTGDPAQFQWKRLCTVDVNLQALQETIDGRLWWKKKSMSAKSADGPSPSQEESLTDKVAAIVEAFYHLSARSRKDTLMR